ncbi:MAG: 1-acyl-sn-glycerol-3-phosphate acyltransferase, partial [Ferruginibacter sp.]
MSSFSTRLKESRFIKGIVYAVIGVISYPGINIVNKLEINGMENLENLPKKNVLFVSNHQTYFADVITFIHIFCAASWRKKNKLGVPYYLLWPFTRIMYVAAEETMKSSWLSKL